jgi:anti-sigma28 factor (negative regulator of flagellin synthesis)
LFKEIGKDVAEKGGAVPLNSICLFREELQEMFMKAQKLRQEDHDLTFPLEKIARSPLVMDHLQQDKPKEHRLKDQLAQGDVEIVRRGLEQLKVRNERIEALKAQVNAGTYQMNSTHIAQKMVGSPLARKVLDHQCYTMFAFKDEE